MRRLNIAVVDLVTNRSTRALYSRFMNANLAGLLAQAVAVWSEQLGHRVRYLCFTGGQDILREIGNEVDVLFISAFTRSAQTAYALSSHFRSQGAVTVLGGPHARCYPDDAILYFDYVLGFTDRELDRKSTRLNSSHSQISYAVFCLKKKKKSTTIRSSLLSNCTTPHSFVF